MGFFTDILKDIPTNAVLRERIIMAETEIERLGKENTELKTEKTHLLEENKKLMDELSKMKASAKHFVEYRGAKFRKLPDGTYDKTVVYCQHCESPMAAKSSANQFECKCGLNTDFKKIHFTMDNFFKDLK